MPPKRVEGSASPSACDGRPAQWRLAIYRRCLALSALLLLAATWRLWTPQEIFPQVPLFAFARHVPRWLDAVGVAGMLAGLAAALAARSQSRCWRVGLLLFTAATAGMVVLDQHRLQAWTYQCVLASVVIALTPPREAMLLLRWWVVSIYFHSALSKLDYSFLEGYGQVLAGALLNAAGMTFDDWPESMRWLAAWFLPVGELLVAVGLVTRRFRLAAVIAVVLLHTTLVIALGPWGLGHKPGVLVWNVLFVLQVVLLFGVRRRVDGAAGSRAASAAATQRGAAWVIPAARCLVVTAMLLPFLEPFGWFDPWPSWSLYSTRQARLRVYVRESERGVLPASLQPHVGPASFDGSWCPVRIDRWSLETLDAPISPQVRFQFGVVLAVAGDCRSQGNIRVEIDTAASRLTGQRETRHLTGLAEIRPEARRFWLNAQPRAVADTPVEPISGTSRSRRRIVADESLRRKELTSFDSAGLTVESQLVE